jgi:hypothetical protein
VPVAGRQQDPEPWLGCAGPRSDPLPIVRPGRRPRQPGTCWTRQALLLLVGGGAPEAAGLLCGPLGLGFLALPAAQAGAGAAAVSFALAARQRSVGAWHTRPLGFHRHGYHIKDRTSGRNGRAFSVPIPDLTVNRARRGLDRHRRDCSKSPVKSGCIYLLPTTAVWQSDHTMNKPLISHSRCRMC